jgi:hypothetical protein
VVDVVRAHHQPDELLLHERVFVRGLRAGETSKLPSEFGQPLGYEVERFVPGRGLQPAIAADERRRQPVGVLHERRPEPPLHAQHPDARRCWLVVDPGDPVGGVDAHHNPAADAAVRTGASDLAVHQMPPDFGRSACVGQLATHDPHDVQIEARNVWPNPGVTRVPVPWPARPIAPMCCNAWQAVTQRPQRMHDSSWNEKNGFESSTAAPVRGG